MHRLVLSVAATLLLGFAGRWAAADEVPAHVRAFVKSHCSECHGPQKQESDLRLDTLAADFGDPAVVAAWTSVLERIEAGEMPPEEKPRPAVADLRPTQSWIRNQLAHAAQASDAILPGRGPRRLNRVEYQNTVNQLLGIDLELAGYLPEDGTLAGFDKVGRALSISPVLVERYMEAADAALDEAFDERPHVPSTTKRYSLWADCGRARRTFTRNGVWADNGDAVLIFYTNDKFFYVESFEAPRRGKYRIRFSAYGTLLGQDARRTSDPVVVGLHGGDFKSSNRVSHLVEFFSTDWERPREFEAVDLLEAGHSFKLTMAGRPAWTYEAADYVGPVLAVQWVEIEGPLDDGAAQRRREMLLGDVDPARGTQADAERLLRQFAGRAFRRPVADADVQPYLAIMDAQFAAGASFRAALKVGFKAVLCSPRFLFLDRQPEALDDYDIAARLSYFLWSLPPDDELLAAAAANSLRSADERRRQVERLLADPRAQAFTAHFLDGWLNLKSIDFTTPDRDLYPEFDEPLRDAMLRETRLFFDELLTHDLSAANIVDSEFAMLNERLARHYGIAGVRGDEMRRVSLEPGSVRGGMLTQASVLKVTADGTVTSPVLRGVWLLDRIVGRPAPPPPPGVPGLEPDVRGATTIREQLAKHRQSAACASCHRRIDPPGFALECFDPIGGLRDRYRIALAATTDETAPVAASTKTPTGPTIKFALGPTVEASDVLPDGRKFSDIREFKQLLSADPEAIARNVASKMFTYAVGREPDLLDRNELDAALDRVGTNYGLRSLIKELTASEAFVGR